MPFFSLYPSLSKFACPSAQPRIGLEWYVAGALCTVFAFFLVLLQYTVSESLYGIDGDNGPYDDFPSQDSPAHPATPEH
jgi:hypothetical protein